MFKKKKSRAVAALYAASPTDVSFVRQIGVTSSTPQTISLETGPEVEFWDSKSKIKKLDLIESKAAWLPLNVRLPRVGSLERAPSLLFFLNGIVPSILASAEDPRDSLRNEYIALAILLKNSAAAWNAYGPTWTGPLEKIVELFEDSHFQPLLSPVEFDLADSEFSENTEMLANGCKLGSSGGAYPYPYILDIDGRLQRARQEVMAAVVEYFYAHAQKIKLKITRSDVAHFFRVSSAYRNPARNLCVGGDPYSRHQWGLALDLSVFPDSTHAAKVAAVFNLDVGTLWRDYRDVAARALSSAPESRISCKQGRLRAEPNAISKFSAYEVFCGCEGNGEFLNCEKDALVVDHVHVGF